VVLKEGALCVENPEVVKPCLWSRVVVKKKQSHGVIDSPLNPFRHFGISGFGK
jgi:hypothetical protein